MFKHTPMFMATKTITITEEVYKVLASEKKKDQSFSKVILRTHKKKGSWEAVSKFIGAWEHVPDEVIDNMKKDIEKLSENSMKSVARKVRGI